MATHGIVPQLEHLNVVVWCSGFCPYIILCPPRILLCWNRRTSMRPTNVSLKCVAGSILVDGENCLVEIAIKQAIVHEVCARAVKSRTASSQPCLWLFDFNFVSAQCFLTASASFVRGGHISCVCVSRPSNKPKG